MMDRDLSRTTLESFLYSIASLRHTDLRPHLSQVKIPTYGFYGERDIVVDPSQWKPLLEGVPHSRIQRFKKAGHFIMLDEPQVFYNRLRDFLES
jgi:pimeloyl-ACP methyl ester carboxylesterase